ncbi:MAG: phenylacetate--CoA ligase family protein [Planctomycetes bacterium]|nr:phenylacetate--CoA ligase family protein [Planctomycetota bacterium]
MKPDNPTSASVNTSMQALVEHLGRSERWSPDRLRASQLRQLRALLAHALEHSPFHRDRLAMTPAEATRIEWADWEALPTLPRAELQAAGEHAAAACVPQGHGEVTWQSTTGSTGRPLRIATSAFTRFVNAALTLRDHLWHGRDATGRLAVARAHPVEGDFDTWGAPVAELYRTGPLRVVDVFRPIAEQLELIAAFDPSYLLTYASNAHALAREALARGIALPNLREVRAFGELARDDLPALCRRAFDARCSDLYSAEETGPIAGQCVEGGRHHVNAEALLVEILDDAGHAAPVGTLGRVVVTAMHNFAMPLLRYELGDYAALDPPCACGRTLPVLSRIAGRRRNMLRLPDGSTHWPSFPAPVWLPFPAIRKVQLVQTALDTVEVRIEAARDLEESERERLFTSLRERLGWPLELHLRRVPRIGRADDHKFEDFVSLLGDT